MTDEATWRLAPAHGSGAFDYRGGLLDALDRARALAAKQDDDVRVMIGPAGHVVATIPRPGH